MKQHDALTILKTGANAFLTGEPGSGKTHTVNAYVSWLRAHSIEPAITASTGIAATHVGGMTIHSWSGIGISESLSDADVDRIAAKEHVARRVAKAQVLIIDEISMLSGNVLSMVDRVVQEIRRDERPFGGMQVVLVGDFFQLPPISKGRGERAPFAFESETFRALNPVPLYLSEQHRQEDQKFCELLSRIREGTSDVSDISRLMTRESTLEDVDTDIPRLYTHNADVDRENAEKLAALPGAEKLFPMQWSGSETLVDALKRGCLSPERLALKEGAVVMFTKNNPLANFSNGTLGTVIGFESGTNAPLVETRDGRVITVAAQDWVVEQEGKIRATITQVPLRLAWAITIHKSQGQSLDAAVIDVSRAFEYGQGYVALSRLRSLSGLYLAGWHEHALAIHPAVVAQDQVFRALSAEAVGAFSDLGEERDALEERFIRACGGTLEVRAEDFPVEKRTTYDESCALMEEGKSFVEIAKVRSLTLGTIVDHAEKLVAGGRLGTSAVMPLMPERVRTGLPQIFECFDKLGTGKLTHTYVKLGRKYTFDELKMARLLHERE